MNPQSDATDKTIMLALEGFEYAVKISGAGAGAMAKLLLALANQENRTTGKLRLSNMMKSERPIHMVSVQDEKQAEKFVKELKSHKFGYAIAARENGATDFIIYKDNLHLCQNIMEDLGINSAHVHNAEITTEWARPIEKEETKENSQGKENPKRAQEQKVKKNQSENFSRNKESSTRKKENVSVRNDLLEATEKVKAQRQNKIKNKSQAR